jgi:hypothetical protein
VSFKDVMSRALAKELSMEETPVSEIMTPEPEHVSPETTVVEAMQIMHDNSFLTLPVCEEDGAVVGVVDVMDLIYGCGGADGWRSIFDSAMDADDATDAQSEAHEDSVVRSLRATTTKPLCNVPLMVDTPLMYREPKPIESIEFAAEGGEETSFHGSIISDIRGLPKYGSVAEDRDIGSLAMSAADKMLSVYKVVDAAGNIHRITCQPSYAKLLKLVAAKLGSEVNPSSLQLKFIDDEGDTVVISGDDDLVDAIDVTKKTGVNALKLSVAVLGTETSAFSATVGNNIMLIGIGAGAVLAVAAGAFMLMKPRK